MLDATNTSPELEASDVNLAVFSVGAIEQHGPHLPLCVDWALGETVARMVAERLNAFLLPGIPYGTSEAHEGFRGSISLAHETLRAVVQDIVRSLLAQGFRRVVLLNFHGGNIVLKIAVRELNLSQDRGKVVLVQPVQEARGRISRILVSAQDEQHAGEMETSMMMHIAPDQVGDERIDHVPEMGPVYFDYARMKEFCPDGIWGRPSLATAEKGKQVIDAMVEATVECVEDMFGRLGVPAS